MALTKSRNRMTAGAPVNVLDYGAVGDGVADDTAAINAALAATPNVHFPAGVYVYTGTLVLPDGARVTGAGAPRIATFPQTGGDKSLLRPGYKGQISGSTILFTGTGTTAATTTLRSDRFASVTPMARYIGVGSLDIRDIAFVQNMDVLDAGGSLTTGATDNRATAYTAGLLLASTPMSSFTRFTLFGYFADAGLVIYAGTDLASSLNPDYNTFTDCLLSGGTAIIGHDTAAGASSTALTGTRFVGTGLYAYDHHTRADGNFDVPAIYIDGYITGTIGKIRGHSFVGCNIRCLANAAISLDHADDIQFASCVWELSLLSGVVGADAGGGFVGTANTGDLWVFGGAGTSQPTVSTFLTQTAGKTVWAGGGEFDGFMVAEGNHGVRVGGDETLGDSFVQWTDDLSSTVTGWKLRRDGDQADDFVLTYANVEKFKLNTSGQIESRLALAPGSAQTIATGVVARPNASLFSISTEAAAATDDLVTITGGTATGEIIILQAANSSQSVVAKDGTGNLRLAGDFTLDHAQDRLMLIYDGTNWCELSRSDNTA